MTRQEELSAAVVSLPFAERLAVLEALENSLSDEYSQLESIAMQAEVRLMEHRLADYEAGKISARAWGDIEAEIRKQL